MFRRIILFTMIGSFLILEVLDLRAGHIRIGLAELLLGAVQALIFV